MGRAGPFIRLCHVPGIVNTLFFSKSIASSSETNFYFYVAYVVML